MHFSIMVPPGPWAPEFQELAAVQVPPGPWALEHLAWAAQFTTEVAREIIRRRRQQDERYERLVERMVTDRSAPAPQRET